MPQELFPLEHEDAQPSSVIAWLEERMRDATITVSNIPLSDTRSWNMTDDGQFANLKADGTPRFFTINGRRISTSGREVDSFDQPGIIEVSDPSDPDGAVGTVGLLVDKASGDVLVTAAAEPLQALPGQESGAYLSLRASVQGSFSNLRENRVPLSEFVDPTQYNHFKSSNPGRIQGKIRYGFTFVDKNDIDLTNHTNSRWFSTREINHAIRQGAPFNAMFDSAYTLYRASTVNKARPPFTK